MKGNHFSFGRKIKTESELKLFLFELTQFYEKSFGKKAILSDLGCSSKYTLSPPLCLATTLSSLLHLRIGLNCSNSQWHIHYLVACRTHAPQTTSDEALTNQSLWLYTHWSSNPTQIEKIVFHYGVCTRWWTLHQSR